VKSATAEGIELLRLSGRVRKLKSSLNVSRQAILRDKFFADVFPYFSQLMQPADTTYHNCMLYCISKCQLDNAKNLGWRKKGQKYTTPVLQYPLQNNKVTFVKYSRAINNRH